ncbi:hypothetical protein BC629DRAFT_1441908 [Irpex lacteus]|nr:hypothetical protein BC629DRAFT_1441908 [Irpex lacteus]
MTPSSTLSTDLYKGYSLMETLLRDCRVEHERTVSEDVSTVVAERETSNIEPRKWQARRHLVHSRQSHCGFTDTCSQPRTVSDQIAPYGSSFAPQGSHRYSCVLKRRLLMRKLSASLLIQDWTSQLWIEGESNGIQVDSHCQCVYVQLREVQFETDENAGGLGGPSERATKLTGTTFGARTS